MLRARKDWENCNMDVDEGNYWEFLPFWYRVKTWDGWQNFKRMIKHRSLLELRWYRYRWYKRHRKKPDIFYGEMKEKSQK